MLSQLILTKAQRKAVYRLFTHNPSGAHTYKEFRSRFVAQYGGYIAIYDWCGMYVGVEKDGYTHS